MLVYYLALCVLTPLSVFASVPTPNISAGGSPVAAAHSVAVDQTAAREFIKNFDTHLDGPAGVYKLAAIKFNDVLVSLNNMSIYYFRDQFDSNNARAVAIVNELAQLFNKAKKPADAFSEITKISQQWLPLLTDADDSSSDDSSTSSSSSDSESSSDELEVPVVFTNAINAMDEFIKKFDDLKKIGRPTEYRVIALTYLPISGATLEPYKIKILEQLQKIGPGANADNLAPVLENVFTMAAKLCEKDLDYGEVIKNLIAVFTSTNTYLDTSVVGQSISGTLKGMLLEYIDAGKKHPAMQLAKPVVDMIETALGRARFPLTNQDLFGAQPYTIQEFVIASYKGNEKLVNSLIDTYPHLMDESGDLGSALVYAAYGYIKHGKKESLDLFSQLINKGADYTIIVKSGVNREMFTDVLPALECKVAEEKLRKKELIDVINTHLKAEGMDDQYLLKEPVDTPKPVQEMAPWKKFLAMGVAGTLTGFAVRYLVNRNKTADAKTLEPAADNK